jgi:predicted extracellular nuclease
VETSKEQQPKNNAQKRNEKSLMKKLLLTVLAMCLVATAQAQILITQYYEGPGTSKWIELTNIGSSSINLTTVAIGLWTNANAEGYKSNTAPSNFVNLTGTLAAGSSFLLGNSGNTAPTYALATLNSNTVANFNGNDSIAIYTPGTFATANILDAIGFTNTGNEGPDLSFVRLTSGVGWNTTLGSDVLNFGTIWQSTPLATVNSAAASTEPRLGYSAIPEPSTYALLGLGLLGIAILRRKQAARA